MGERASMRLAIFLSIFFLASMVAGNTHYSCTCHNGGSYYRSITTIACARYAMHNYQWGGVHFDTTLGRCLSDKVNGKSFGGREWDSVCKDIAKEGYPCSDNVGRCLALAKEVSGRCD